MSMQEILEELPKLSAEEIKLVGRAARELENKQAAEQSESDGVPKARIAPLHPGVWTVADDFDEPLPDEFWLGEDA